MSQIRPSASTKRSFVCGAAWAGGVSGCQWAAIRERLTEMFGTVFKFPGGPERSIAQHRLITQAIAAEDAERARQAMTEHILRVEQELAQLDR